MSQLTEDQARTLADGFQEVSEAVGDFRLDHLAQMTEEESAEFHGLEKKLSNQSLHFTAQAIQITMEDLQPTLQRIRQVTVQVKQAVTNLDEIRRALTIAASLASLGAAITSGNPGAIASSLQDTIEAVEAPASPSPATSTAGHP